MLASFIVRLHSKRLDNLHQTLRFLEMWHKKVISQSQLILVCHDSVDRVSNAFERYDHINLNLTYMKNSKQTNIGVQTALAEKIVLLDGDRISPPGYYEKTLSQIERGKQISIKTIKNIERNAEDEEIESENYPYFEEERSLTHQAGQRCIWSGNTVFMKSDFYQAGMMDESYEGYGFEDQDMGLNMEKSGVVSILVPEHEIHLWHERKTYGDGDHKKMFINNGLRFCKKWNLPLPNFLREEIAKHRKAWI